MAPVTTTIIKGEAPVGITYIKYIKQYKGPVDYVVMDKCSADPNYMRSRCQGLSSKRGEALYANICSPDGQKLVAEEGEFVMYPGIFPPIRDAEKVAPRMVFMDNPSEEEFKKLMTVTFRDFLCQIIFGSLISFERLKEGRPASGRPSFFDEEKMEKIMNGTAVLTHVFERPLRAFRQDPQLWVTTVVGVVIAYLSLSPTIMLFYGSFLSKPLGVPGNFTLATTSAYTDPLTYQLLFNSFVFATGSSILATFLAATLAWISIRTNAPYRKFFELIAIIPNIFPPVMLAVSWTVLLSRERA